MTDDAETVVCAVSVHRYGKGKEYYTLAIKDPALPGTFPDRIGKDAWLTEPLPVPRGMQVSRIRENEAFYVNTTDREQAVEPPFAEKRTVLRDTGVSKRFTVPPYDAELFVRVGTEETGC